MARYFEISKSSKFCMSCNKWKCFDCSDAWTSPLHPSSASPLKLSCFELVRWPSGYRGLFHKPEFHLWPDPMCKEKWPARTLRVICTHAPSNKYINIQLSEFQIFVLFWRNRSNSYTSLFLQMFSTGRCLRDLMMCMHTNPAYGAHCDSMHLSHLTRCSHSILCFLYSRSRSHQESV